MLGSKDQYEMQQQKERRNEYAANHRKIIILSLIQSALERKNQLRQAAMRRPQISRDIRRSAGN
jgi:hypothetical protein